MLRNWIALVAISPLFGATGGSIAGTIVDPAGARMPEVAVAARNVDTGMVHRTATNDQGFYAFPDLPIGRYALDVDHSGFQPYRHPPVDVVTNAALRIDIALVLGGHTTPRCSAYRSLARSVQRRDGSSPDREWPTSMPRCIRRSGFRNRDRWNFVWKLSTC